MTNIERQSRDDMRALGFWFLVASAIGGLIGGTVVAVVVYVL